MTATPIYRVFALGFFRSSVFFICAVIAFSQREDRTGAILLMLVFLIDVASYQILQVITISNETVYARVWKDTLTNRLFYVKMEVRQHVTAGGNVRLDYKIINVLDFRPTDHQPSLPFKGG